MDPIDFTESLVSYKCGIIRTSYSPVISENYHLVYLI